MTENWNNEIIGKIPLLNIRQFDIRRFQALSGKDNLSVCDLEVLAAASIWQNNWCFYIKTIRYNHYIIVLSALGELILEDLKEIELYGCGRALDTNSTTSWSPMRSGFFTAISSARACARAEKLVALTSANLVIIASKSVF